MTIQETVHFNKGFRDDMSLSFKAVHLIKISQSKIFLLQNDCVLCKKYHPSRQNNKHTPVSELFDRIYSLKILRHILIFNFDQNKVKQKQCLNGKRNMKTNVYAVVKSPTIRFDNSPKTYF